MEKKVRTPAAIAINRAQCEVALDLIIEPMRRVASHLGYAIAVHGSLARDIDLIAVPWTERADGPERLVDQLVGAIAGVLGSCSQRGEWSDKPHGRRAVTLLGWADAYIDIDLSILPLVAKDGAA